MLELNDYKVFSYSENAILIQWPELISTQLHQHIISVSELVENLKPWFVEQVCSYNSLLVYYRFEAISAHDFKAKLISAIEQVILSADEKPLIASHAKQVTIDVCYDVATGWDIETICQQKQCTLENIIDWHTSRTYRAYALGFTPGFCYLASLDKRLHLPRKKIPRKKVPAGAVAIAHHQTAIYPDSSPGGWHIIGQTPTAMYEMAENQFKPLINVGDIVSFNPISREAFIAQGGNIVKER